MRRRHCGSAARRREGAAQAPSGYESAMDRGSYDEVIAMLPMTQGRVQRYSEAAAGLSQLYRDRFRSGRPANAWTRPDSSSMTRNSGARRCRRGSDRRAPYFRIRSGRSADRTASLAAWRNCTATACGPVGRRRLRHQLREGHGGVGESTRLAYRTSRPTIGPGGLRYGPDCLGRCVFARAGRQRAVGHRHVAGIRVRAAVARGCR
jgi:hypothetical protein